MMAISDVQFISPWITMCQSASVQVYALTKVAKNLSNALFNNKLFNNTLLNVALSFLTNRANSSSYLLLRQLYALLVVLIAVDLLGAGYLVY